MSGKIFETTKPQSYSFEFGSDGKIHTVSFKGNLSEPDEEKILEAAGKQAYEKAGEAIRLYLEQRSLKYSDFIIKETFWNHEKIMEWADTLLRSDDSNTIDARIGSADHYFSIMDNQKWVHKDRCEGCYYAIKRSISRNPFDPLYRHYVIGQTFILDESEDESITFFAIRRKDEHPPFHNLYISKGNPVLPTFGCVDMVGILRNIGHIYNARQAKDIAIKWF